MFVGMATALLVNHSKTETGTTLKEITMYLKTPTPEDSKDHRSTRRSIQKETKNFIVH